MSDEMVITKQSKSGKARPPIPRIEQECGFCGVMVETLPWPTKCPQCWNEITPTLDKMKKF